MSFLKLKKISEVFRNEIVLTSYEILDMDFKVRVDRLKNNFVNFKISNEF